MVYKRKEHNKDSSFIKVTANNIHGKDMGKKDSFYSEQITPMTPADEVS